MNRWVFSVSVVTAMLLWIGPASATPFFFSTGDPDGLIATASRPESPGKIEIESADDFAVTGANTLKLTGASFKGLLPTGASLSTVTDVRVEIYRVFPLDSDVGRTPQVPTRVNSPSDVELDSRASSAGNLTFTPAVVSASFTANNSVLNGIHPAPGFHTGGDLAVTGQQVSFNVVFTTPFTLPADHYFFVPQVQLSSGDFLWLSAARPILPPGTPFPPGVTDLQSWIRNSELDPDWLRVGMDIVGGGSAFNAVFTVSGDLEPVPEPATLLLFGTTTATMAFIGQWRRRRQN